MRNLPVILAVGSLGLGVLAVGVGSWWLLAFVIPALLVGLIVVLLR